MNKAKKRLIKGVLLLSVLSMGVGAFSLEGRGWSSHDGSNTHHLLADSFKRIPLAFSHAKSQPKASISWTESAALFAAAGEAHGMALPHPDMSWVQALDVSQVAAARLPLLSGPAVAAGHYAVTGHWVPAEQAWTSGNTDLLASGRFGAPAAGTGTMAGGHNDPAASFEGLQIASSMRDSPMASFSDPGNGWQSAFYGGSDSDSSGGSQQASSRGANGAGSASGAEASGSSADPAPIRVAVSAVPEPSTWTLMGVALLGLFFLRRRRPHPF